MTDGNICNPWETRDSLSILPIYCKPNPTVFPINEYAFMKKLLLEQTSDCCIKNLLRLSPFMHNNSLYYQDS